MSSTPKSFTGRVRRRTTSWRVKLADFLAQWIITIGGIGTIVAVSLVLCFLVYTVLPLFLPATISRPVAISVPWQTVPLRLRIDEAGDMGWSLLPDGALEVVRFDAGPEQGKLLTRLTPLEADGPALTAVSQISDDGSIALGFGDGTVRLGQIFFERKYLDPAELPAADRATLEKLKPGQLAPYAGGLVEKTPVGQLRLQVVNALFEKAVPLNEAQPAPIARLDYRITSAGATLCAMTIDHQLWLQNVGKREDFLTGETVVELEGKQLDYVPPAGHGLPSQILLTGLADNVLVVWPDGLCLRFLTNDLNNVRVAPPVDLLADETAQITALGMMLGGNTLIVGDSTGQISGWFRIKNDEFDTPDRAKLVEGHRFPGFGKAVRTVEPASGNRLFLAGYDDGQLRVFHMTTNALVIGSRTVSGKPIEALTFSPDDNLVLAMTGDRLNLWELDAKYPEASLNGLFGRLWYEENPSPSWVWQSTSGNSAYEPKFSLVNLIFGTLKATFYSLLFGVPIALLAAIYTSEFMRPGVKATIKPTIELMASLPSVVLGFLAGVIFAPIIGNMLPTVLVSFVTVPVVMLLGAYLWQLLPYKTGLIMAHYRFWFILPTLPIGFWLATQLGRPVELWLFEGDIKAWLAGGKGSPLGAWMFALLPLAALGTAFLLSTVVNPIQRTVTAKFSRLGSGLFDLAKFCGAVGIGLLLAWCGSYLLTYVIGDPRGTFVGTYDQRNALVVGFVMGFAIIPIVYTIAEDALSTVPEHLRSASLGCGATQWQTAVRVVIPTATSGLFSAVMIGLGRAVGETMIVLMAAGSTPVIDLNMFNGFRTLSANLATELPEAVRGSEHYYILFVAALVLFMITFVINTAAEIIRQRFRRKSYEL